MTRAPTAFAIWHAAVPTPPAADWTTALSPRARCPTVTRPCHAVRKTTGKAAPCTNDQPAGSGRTSAAGTLILEAYPPNRVTAITLSPGANRAGTPPCGVTSPPSLPVDATPPGAAPADAT